uniref:Uncharacterized protein n=1 Tax=Glossina austeni TaxID=7395 RepID=A0A1A9V0U7_GLOAU
MVMVIGLVNLLEVVLSYTGGNVQLKIGDKIIETGTLSQSKRGIYEVAAASPYINIQNGAEDEGNATNEEENDDEIFQDAEEEQITECWLIPEDVNTVDTIFQAMTECQA